MNNEKHAIIITSGLTLLPMLIGLLLWRRLPDQLPTHFNFEGTADGYSSKAFAVFGLPLIILAGHILSAYATMRDPKNRSLSRRINLLVLCICPAVSIFVSLLIYPASMNAPVDLMLLTSLFLGLVYIAAGNYLPKCRHNHTVGIRLPWTITNEDIWDRTHRMAGPLWMAGGILLLLNAFLRYHRTAILLSITVILIILPAVYSLFLYIRDEHSNTKTPET